jgi:hypothetical protein
MFQKRQARERSCFFSSFRACGRAKIGAKISFWTYGRQNSCPFIPNHFPFCQRNGPGYPPASLHADRVASSLSSRSTPPLRSLRHPDRDASSVLSPWARHLLPPLTHRPPPSSLLLPIDPTLPSSHRWASICASTTRRPNHRRGRR